MRNVKYETWPFDMIGGFCQYNTSNREDRGHLAGIQYDSGGHSYNGIEAKPVFDFEEVLVVACTEMWCSFR